MAITKITNSLVATNAIQGTLIADNAITSVHIAQNQVTAVQIPDGSITATQLGANSVDSSELVDGSIDTSHIADAQITTAKLGTNQVTSAKIAQNSIEARHIADGSITDTQLGSGAFTMGTITTTGAIRGPASLTIDPATVGDNTGTVVIAGNLQVDGTTTTVNSTTVDIVDKNITLGKGGSASANNGGGITIDGAAATLLYQHSDTSWQINKPLGVTGGITTAGNIVVSGTTLVSDDQTNDWVKQSVSGTTSTLTFGNTESTAGQAKWEYTRSTGRFKGYIGANSVTNFMSIDSSGRVGIGNSSPDFTLDVGADKDTWISRIYNTGSDASAQALLVRSDATAAHDATVMGVYADSSYKMVVRSTGRVGIGQTNPKGSLEIYNNSTTTDGDGTATMTMSGQDSIILYGHGNVNSKNYGSIAWTDGGNRRRAMITSAAENADQDFLGLAFYTQGADGPGDINESMRIAHSGNIGIGETDPDNILHIKTTASGGPQIQMGDGTNYAFMNFDGTSLQLSTQRDMVDGTWYNTSKSWGGINIKGPSTGSSITFVTANNNNTAPSTRMTIKSDGHIKFSTASKLLLGNTNTAASTINAYTSTVSSGLYSALRMIDNTSASSYWDMGAHGGTSTNLDFCHNAVTTPKVRFQSDGSIISQGEILEAGGVREYRNDIYLAGSTSYTFDVDVKSIGASGQVLEVFAGFTHYASAYAAVIKQVWAHRSTVQSDVVLLSSIVNVTSTNGGSWSVSWVDANTIRLTKNAGASGGAGHGYILVRGAKT